MALPLSQSLRQYHTNSDADARHRRLAHCSKQSQSLEAVVTKLFASLDAVDTFGLHAKSIAMIDSCTA